MQTLRASIASPLFALYRAVGSPFLRQLGQAVGLGPAPLNRCRYKLSCSRYAEMAIVNQGVFKGGWLAIKRLLSCHPFGRGKAGWI